MSRMRAGKALLKEILESENWRERLEKLDLPRRERVGPLMSFLLTGGTLTGRAAAALGADVAEISRLNPEDGRVLMRRFLWHMNEESGNLGWGIPQSTAEACARSPRLAREFGHILISYIRDTGREDNYVDHALLRRDCLGAVARLLAARPEFADKAVPALLAALRDDEDLPCRGLAAHALAQLPKIPPEALPDLHKLADDPEAGGTPVDIFDGHAARTRTVAELARDALGRV